MARTLTCDFCNKTVELDRFTSLPTNWGKLTINSRTSGNIGGMVFKLDICTDCNKVKDYLNSQKRAVEFLKGALLKL